MKFVKNIKYLRICSSNINDGNSRSIDKHLRLLYNLNTSYWGFKYFYLLQSKSIVGNNPNNTLLIPNNKSNIKQLKICTR